MPDLHQKLLTTGPAPPGQLRSWFGLFSSSVVLIATNNAHVSFGKQFVRTNHTHVTVQYDTYLLSPWSTVLSDKLTGFQLVKKLPALYGTRRFITTFTSARHLSLSSASSIQSIPPHPTSWISILILSSNLSLGLQSGLFPSGFPHNPRIRLSSPPYALHAPSNSLLSTLSPAQYWVSSTDH